MVNSQLMRNTGLWFALYKVSALSVSWYYFLLSPIDASGSLLGKHIKRRPSWWESTGPGPERGPDTRCCPRRPWNGAFQVTMRQQGYTGPHTPVDSMCCTTTNYSFFCNSLSLSITVFQQALLRTPPTWSVPLTHLGTVSRRRWRLVRRQPGRCAVPSPVR